MQLLFWCTFAGVENYLLYMSNLFISNSRISGMLQLFHILAVARLNFLLYSVIWNCCFKWLSFSLTSLGLIVCIKISICVLLKLLCLAVFNWMQQCIIGQHFLNQGISNLFEVTFIYHYQIYLLPILWFRWLTECIQSLEPMTSLGFKFGKFMVTSVLLGVSEHQFCPSFLQVI